MTVFETLVIVLLSLLAVCALAGIGVKLYQLFVEGKFDRLLKYAK